MDFQVFFLAAQGFLLALDIDVAFPMLFFYVYRTSHPILQVYTGSLKFQVP